MTFLNKIYFTLLLVLAPVFSLAAPTDDLSTMGQWIGSEWVNFTVILFISIGVFYFIYGAFQIVIAGSNEAIRDMGKSHMINALIGIFVMISIWGLVNILLQTFDFGNRTDVNLNPLIVVPVSDFPI